MRPRVGIVCGSGLSTLASSLRDAVHVPYAALEGFGASTVPGHKSSLAFGFIADVPVVAMLGRFHAYEGHKMSAIMYPVRIMARLGVKNLIVTNAAGSLNPDIPVGTIVVIHDHLGLPNLTGFNPLFGPRTSAHHARFLPTSNAYSVALRRLLFLTARKHGVPSEALAEGIYAWVSGPTYESPAEGRMLRAAGADVVGMSTVPEILAANEEGMEAMAISLVTNFVVIPDKYRSIRDEVDAELAGKPMNLVPDSVVSHDEVLEVGESKAGLMRSLVEGVVAQIPA